LEIRSAPGGTSSKAAAPGETAPEKGQSANALTLSVVALHNPVAAGKELTYEIRVVNNTDAVDRRVTVTAIVPDGMVPVPLGTTGPDTTQFEIEHQTVGFKPVMSIQPGETLIYRVRVRTKSAGQLLFRAELTSRNITQPIVQEAETEVFSQEGK
jgi:uncharacterized repeat protein (TIGR01451 family)